MWKLTREQLFHFHLTLFVALIPLHGSITVFLPGYFRFWKEVLLITFGLLWITTERKKNTKWILKNPETWALFGLLFIMLHIITATDLYPAIIAARYLALGSFIFLIVKRLSVILDISPHKKHLARTLALSSLLSLFFGFWAHYGNGYETLLQWYSNTISSWVPNQTIPIYHAIEGVPRMQGMSSGPIEFSHILLGSLFLVSLTQWKQWIQITLMGLLIWGIWESGSRAALIGSLILCLWHIWHFFSNTDNKTKLKVMILGGCITIGSLFFTEIPNTIMTRAGTSDHITRPIEALKKGMENPLWGQFGKSGPAAREHNLITKNSDSAFIAENIFADHWLQLGILGLIFLCGFFYFLFQSMTRIGKLWTFTTILLGSFATIFDMTPITLLFFILFIVLSDKKTYTIK